MISPIILKSLNSNLQITQENEILNLNEKSQMYGLSLNKEDVKEIKVNTKFQKKELVKYDFSNNIKITKFKLTNYARK